MPSLHLFVSQFALPKIHLLPFSYNTQTQNPYSAATHRCRISSTSPRICGQVDISSSCNNLRYLFRHSSLASVAPLEAILFDIDGTLVDSDPIHYYAFREMLQEVGFHGGAPITEEFFVSSISGKHNVELRHVLFPDWDVEKAMKFFDDKEAMFRRLAAEEMKPVAGLEKLIKWVEDNGLRRAAVTNAPRSNADLLISILGLESFFEFVVIGSECNRVKPFPDPYLKALEELGISSKHAFVFEDSVSGIKAGVGAGMPVVGLATGNPERLLSEAGAAMVIKDYTEPKLWAVLDGLEKKTRPAKVGTQLSG